MSQNSVHDFWHSDDGADSFLPFYPPPRATIDPQNYSGEPKENFEAWLLKKGELDETPGLESTEGGHLASPYTTEWDLH